MTDTEKKITEYVDSNKDRFIELLRELIRIPSVTGYEKAAQEFVAEKLENLGFEVDVTEGDLKDMFEKYPETANFPSIGEEGLDMPLMTDGFFTYEQLMASPYDRLKSYKDRPNVVGLLKGNGKGKSLIINGHIDTVPVGDESKWTKSPFGAEIEDGKIYGRGSTDMKGGIAAMLAAAETVRKLGIPLSGDLMLQSVVNEEHSGSGALGVVAQGYTADAAIVAEPAAGPGAKSVSVGNGGGVYWEVRVKGQEAHAGSRWQDGKLYGVSANEKGALVVCNLIKMESEVNRERTLMSLCVGKLHGGTYATASAPECVINGVAYFSPYLGSGSEGLRKVMGMIRDAVLGTDDPWLRENPPSVRFQHYDDAYLLPEEWGEIRDEVAGSVRDVLDTEPECFVFGSGCDARHLANQGGIPTVMYGPGNLPQAHIADEYISIDDYIKSIKVLAVTISRWCR